MTFINSGGQFEGSFVPDINGNVHITWKRGYFWADYDLGEPWGTVCVVMLPYNLLANGQAIIHPKTGNQENAFSYSAYGHIRTHSQARTETIAKSMHNYTEIEADMDLLNTKSDAGDDNSVTLDSDSELYCTGSNDDMD